MSRYIDVELLDDIALQRGITRWEYKMIDSVLFDFPTADVVEVVRCKDCKHAEIQDYAPPSCRYCCKYSALYHAKNFYCSMGERRRDAEIH